MQKLLVRFKSHRNAHILSVLASHQRRLAFRFSFPQFKTQNSIIPRPHHRSSGHLSGHSTLVTPFNSLPSSQLRHTPSLSRYAIILHPSYSTHTPTPTGGSCRAPSLSFRNGSSCSAISAPRKRFAPCYHQTAHVSSRENPGQNFPLAPYESRFAGGRWIRPTTIAPRCNLKNRPLPE
jgi:hypothetical protein